MSLLVSLPPCFNLFITPSTVTFPCKLPLACKVTGSLAVAMMVLFGSLINAVETFSSACVMAMVCISHDDNIYSNLPFHSQHSCPGCGSLYQFHNMLTAYSLLARHTLRVIPA